MGKSSDDESSCKWEPGRISADNLKIYLERAQSVIKSTWENAGGAVVGTVDVNSVPAPVPVDGDESATLRPVDEGELMRLLHDREYDVDKAVEYGGCLRAGGGKWTGSGFSYDIYSNA